MGPQQKCRHVSMKESKYMKHFLRLMTRFIENRK